MNAARVTRWVGMMMFPLAMIVSFYLAPHIDGGLRGAVVVALLALGAIFVGVGTDPAEAADGPPGPDELRDGDRR